MVLYPIKDLKEIEASLGSSIEKFQDKIIFISGATGFIGKNIVECLVWLNRARGLNLSIHSISRDPNSFFERNPHFRAYSEFHLLPGDIRSKEIPYTGGALDFAIHAATDVVGRSDPEDLFASCVYGTSNILHFAMKNHCKKFVLLSSGAVYGEQPSNLAKLPETYNGGIDLSLPSSAYALGKQASEWLVQQSSNRLDVRVARCFAFVGPYLPLDQHFAIGNFIRDALLEKSIEIQGDGMALRTYLYTSDLMIWLLKIMLNGWNGGVWNIGGNEIVSIMDLAKLVVKLISPDLRINVSKEPSGNIHRYVPDLQRAEIQMGLRQKIYLNDAIIKTANWNRLYGEC